MRRCVSRQGPNFLLRPMYSSPAFRPPTNAADPSTTSSLRWFRKLIWKCRPNWRLVTNGWIFTPPWTSFSHHSAGSFFEPTWSNITRHSTPRAAAARSLAASSRPRMSSWMMKNWTQTDSRAEPMASKMASNVCCPSISRRTRFPLVGGSRLMFRATFDPSAHSPRTSAR